MGVIVVGTLYEQNWGGIAWSQPVPGGIVYPQQEISTPFLAYPTQGQLWAENSGIFVAGCSHWQNAPLVFEDQNGFVVTPTYLLDNAGRTWLVNVTNDGVNIQATEVSYPAGPSVVLLTDLVTFQTWQLTAVANGTQVDLQLTLVGGVGGQPQLLALSPNKTLYAIQVSNGQLETAYPLSSEGSAVAIIACALCTFCQYVVPLNQWYDTFVTPITFI